MMHFDFDDILGIVDHVRYYSRILLNIILEIKRYIGLLLKNIILGHRIHIEGIFLHEPFSQHDIYNISVWVFYDFSIPIELSIEYFFNMQVVIRVKLFIEVGIEGK